MFKRQFSYADGSGDCHFGTADRHMRIGAAEFGDQASDAFGENPIKSRVRILNANDFLKQVGAGGSSVLERNSLALDRFKRDEIGRIYAQRHYIKIVGTSEDIAKAEAAHFIGIGTARFGQLFKMRLRLFKDRR